MGFAVLFFSGVKSINEYIERDGHPDVFIGNGFYFVSIIDAAQQKMFLVRERSFELELTEVNFA